MEIRKLDIDIEDLEKKIEDKKKVYEREEKDKDEAINNQSLLFQEMTVRFQHILENTANKLQERVKTGNQISFDLNKLQIKMKIIEG